MEMSLKELKSLRKYDNLVKCIARSLLQRFNNEISAVFEYLLFHSLPAGT